MTFGEKVKEQRSKLHLNQKELAARTGVTRRVITSYENDKSRPRGMAGYKKLAEALEVNVNYLLSEDDEFIAEAAEKYGSRGANQARALVSELSGLFAGGELADEDLDEMMKGIQEAFWIAKEKNKKFARKDNSPKE